MLIQLREGGRGGEGGGCHGDGGDPIATDLSPHFPSGFDSIIPAPAQGMRRPSYLIGEGRRKGGRWGAEGGREEIWGLPGSDAPGGSGILSAGG